MATGHSTGNLELRQDLVRVAQELEVRKGRSTCRFREPHKYHQGPEAPNPRLNRQSAAGSDTQRASSGPLGTPDASWPWSPAVMPGGNRNEGVIHSGLTARAAPIS